MFQQPFTAPIDVNCSVAYSRITQSLEIPRINRKSIRKRFAAKLVRVYMVITLKHLKPFSSRVSSKLLCILSSVQILCVWF